MYRAPNQKFYHILIFLTWLLAMELKYQYRHNSSRQTHTSSEFLKFGELAQGGQFKRYKDNIKHHLQEGGTDITRWELIATDRPRWRTLIDQSVTRISEKRAQQTRDRKARRIAAAAVPAAVFCNICSKPCRSRFGLLSHCSSHARKKNKPTAGTTPLSR